VEESTKIGDFAAIVDVSRLMWGNLAVSDEEVDCDRRIEARRYKNN
jgi:hypothetical protein